MTRAAEAQRQQALLAALWSRDPGDALPAIGETGARATRGLSAYRANAGALAERALGSAFPTVQAMVGAQDFSALAREFWRAHPPTLGDIGEWGAEFPGWLQDHAAFAPWPYLGDCARLDLAVHRCERAEDAELDATSFGLLEQLDPAALRIVLMPGTAAWSSQWPLATIHRAHAHPAAADAPAPFEAVRQALQAQRGEAVLVARQGWRAQVHEVDAATLAWTRLLLAGTPLGAALTQCDEALDFASWLATALRHGWVKEVRRSGD